MKSINEKNADDADDYDLKKISLKQSTPIIINDHNHHKNPCALLFSEAS